MKKTIKLTILLAAFMSMVSINIFAYNIAVKNNDGLIIYYNYINDGEELEVTHKGTSTLDGNGSYSGSITLPDEVSYNGKTLKVTSIGRNAFRECYNLTSVTIPNSVISIGNYAFEGCSSIHSLTIPNSVIRVGSYAFDNCTSLISVTIPNSVTSIGNQAFQNCRSLISITIPNSVTTILNSTFSGCEALTFVSIPNSVISIGNDVFAECHSLKSITIPNSVTTIGSRAFKGCSNITTITFPESITSIAGLAFENCSCLTSVISLIEIPFTINGKFSNNRVFPYNAYENVTLYVPNGTIDKYKEMEGWKDFLFIEEGSGPGGETPEVEQCAKPTIYYKDGKLSYKCETEGVTFQSTITDTDMGAYSSDEVDLTVTYHISVYATKEGYKDSEVAEATLCWIEVDPQKEGITEDTPTEAKQLQALPVLIQAEDGQFSVEGAPEGTKIAVYDASGVELGTAVSRGGKTFIPARLPKGSIAIVKIGERRVKVVTK